MSVLLAGATGTIGRATREALVAQGHDVLSVQRSGAKGSGVLRCDLSQQRSLTQALGSERVDAVVSCMASRTGAPRDAWAVEHDAQLNLMTEARAAGAQHFVLLSAICVQKPTLAFQHAKLAFEQRLQNSGLGWSIVRPTAFFKSLSGQVARVQSGKPFLLFGDGRLTACKPISDRDLAGYLVRCLTELDLQGRVLPIGGPGPAITPIEQAQRLFDMLGQPPKTRRVPVALMRGIAGTCATLGFVNAKIRDRAEFARTGLYYATESMLVWDAQSQRYDAEATPETGSDTLWDHYAAMLKGEAQVDLGAHAMF